VISGAIAVAHLVLCGPLRGVGDWGHDSSIYRLGFAIKLRSHLPAPGLYFPYRRPSAPKCCILSPICGKHSLIKKPLALRHENVLHE
jgi:hypothetical protein